MQAGPADLVLLDQADAHAELGRAQGTGVAAAPAAKDEDVESRCGVRHGLPPKNQATPRIARSQLKGIESSLHWREMPGPVGSVSDT